MTQMRLTAFAEDLDAFHAMRGVPPVRHTLGVGLKKTGPAAGGSKFLGTGKKMVPTGSAVVLTFLVKIIVLSGKGPLGGGFAGNGIKIGREYFSPFLIG